MKYTWLCVSLVSAFGWSAPVAAQAHSDAGVADAGTTEDARAPTPPTLSQFVPAVLPSDVVIDPAGLEILLHLTIDASGRVTEAAITGDDHPSSMATAVLDAAHQLSFVPAMRGAVPIPAQIRFLYRIDPPPAPPPPPPTPPPTEPTAPAVPSSEPVAASYQATAHTRTPPREVTRRELSAAQVGRIAGTRGDTLRAVEILPGVARPPLNSGVVIVRGASPQDSQVLVEGTPVLFLYHLGGLTSFFNTSLLERVDFYPGNFSARFGRAMGGVIDVDVRSPKQDHAHGTLDLNLIDASLLVETPINDRGGFAIAARRSYLDFFFDAIVPDDAFKVVAAPLYWDYQAIGEYRLTDRDRLRVQGFGSRDQMRVVVNEPDASNVKVRGNLGFSSEFHRALTSWLHDYDGGARHELMVGVGTLGIDAEIGALINQHISVPTVFSRAEWHLPIAASLTLDTGWDLVGYRGRVTYDGPSYRNEDGDPGVDAPTQTVIDRVETVMRPAAFAEVGWMPHPNLRVIPGVRVDYTSEVQDVTIDPRLAARWSVTDHTTLKAGVGQFSQPPELGSAFEGLGNPLIKSSSALHVSVGIEQHVGEHLQVGVEGYEKHLWDLPVNPIEGAAPVNQGSGRIYGMELSSRFQYRRTFGFLAYTLSRSERSTRGGPYRLHDFDQPHILNVSAGYDLGRDWDVSGTFRLVSGNPQTPVLGALYNADTDEHLPIYGTVNSARAEVFHRLDLRIQKRWNLGEVKLSLYLDLINAYNAQRTETTEYGFDYRTTTGVSGFPLLPVLGLRGEI